ncbi:hypothetical protein [Microvirga antarctica]|uniref:hypothetical protein n=1 Tax=Microvirga antarctica TaxID=2819233 RepID=UPI001B310693|nr:hypothetical protein [Microvirga antarctica]
MIRALALLLTLSACSTPLNPATYLGVAMVLHAYKWEKCDPLVAMMKRSKSVTEI